eukprot:2889361-Pleurochrysis_carterae.AAC.1
MASGARPPTTSKTRPMTTKARPSLAVFWVLHARACGMFVRCTRALRFCPCMALTLCDACHTRLPYAHMCDGPATCFVPPRAALAPGDTSHSPD